MRKVRERTAGTDLKMSLLKEDIFCIMNTVKPHPNLMPFDTLPKEDVIGKRKHHTSLEVNVSLINEIA